MSKLIVEMPMPKHGCCDCMVELMGLCVIQDKDVPLKNENGDYPTELPKGCPIKGVLPEQHGDLVDADTVLWGEEVPGSEGIVVPVTIGDVIEGYDVPIVIAAERSET